MGEQFLIDTNVIIDFFGNKINDKGKTFISNIFADDFNISIIVENVFSCYFFLFFYFFIFLFGNIKNMLYFCSPKFEIHGEIAQLVRAHDS